MKTACRWPIVALLLVPLIAQAQGREGEASGGQVLGSYYAGQVTADFCMERVPENAGTMNAAFEGWRRRNAGFADRMHAALVEQAMASSGEKDRAAVEALLNQQIQTLMEDHRARLERLDATTAKGFCEKAAAAMADGTGDLETR